MLFPLFTDEELAEDRAMAEARMTSRAVVRRRTGGWTTDPDGAEVPEWATVYEALPCRVAAGSSSGGSRGVTIGSVTWEDATGVGHFPQPSELLADDDLFEVTAGEWAGDVFRIVAATRYHQQTARRLPVVEADRPEEWP